MSSELRVFLINNIERVKSLIEKETFLFLFFGRHFPSAMTFFINCFNPEPKFGFPHISHFNQLAP